MKVRDFVDAIRKNGLQQAFGDLYEYVYVGDREFATTYQTSSYESANREGTTKLVAACAVGQAYINLGATDSMAANRIATGLYNMGLPHFIDYIVNLNDGAGMSFDKIADNVEEEFDAWLDQEIPNV